jgi:hypothetical protein
MHIQSKIKEMLNRNTSLKLFLLAVKFFTIVVMVLRAETTSFIGKKLIFNNKDLPLTVVWGVKIKILIISFIFFGNNAFSQIDNNGCLADSFGIDADLRSGILQFITDPEPPGGSYDWFQGATGKGIINETNTAFIQNLLQNPSVNNNTYEARLQYPALSIIENRFWVDALYARDDFGGTGWVDQTAFAVSSKNGQDPASWGTGPANVLGKNDLIDVAGFMRRAAPHSSFPVPPAPGGLAINYLRGELWFMGLIIRAEPGGDAYMDFEFFVQDLTYNSTTHKFNSGGPDLGHTSFLFGPTGKITKLGDVIFNVSLTGGGTTPSIELRIWMSSTMYNSMRTNPSAFPDLPFNLQAEFDGAVNGAPFGYARITPKGAEQACGKVNGTGENPTVAPWGHRGTKANVYLNNTQTHAISSVAEVAMNMSIYGIDNSLIEGADLCAFPYQTFIVKSRSSASFTAALKDFGGPFKWGKPSTVAATNGTQLSCLNPTTTIAALPARDDVTYLWSTINGNIVGPNNTDTITVDRPGTYTLNATLSSGCPLPVSSAVVTRVAGQPPFSSAIATGNVACSPSTGAVNLTTTGGSAPFTYAWSNGGSTQNLSGVIAGEYTVTVTDAAGCTISASDTVTAAIPLVLVPILDNPTCNGSNDGSINIAVSGGLALYTYLWSTGNTLSTMSNVLAGSYGLTVTDANGCTATGSYTLTQPAVIAATLSKVDDTNNDPILGTGTITMTNPTGGTSPYTFLWTGPSITMANENDQNLTTLDYGLYQVTITDVNGCTFTASIFIYEPEVCNDGIDNDGDGLTDCLDPDCKPEAPTALSDPSVCVDEEFIVYTATSIYNIVTPTSGQNEFVWTIPPGSAIWYPGPIPPKGVASPPYGETVNVKYTTTQGGLLCVRVRIDGCLSDPVCVNVDVTRVPDPPKQIIID